MGRGRAGLGSARQSTLLTLMTFTYFFEDCRHPSLFTTLLSSQHFHHFTSVSSTLPSCSFSHKAML